MFLVYFFVALIASMIGSLAGLGGGVIIKPILDVINAYDSLTISVLSSLTVFSMTCITLLHNTRHGAKITPPLWYIAAGGAVGGLVGQWGFQLFLKWMQGDDLAKGYQSLLLLIVLVLSLIMTDLSLASKHFQKPVPYIISGLLLGFISSFLGIGGGPLNVVMLVTFFAMDRKTAVYGSIFIIFASQGMRLIFLVLMGDFIHINIEMAWALIPGGVMGGFVGSRLYRALEISKIMIIFNVVTVSVILLNIYNVWNFFN